MLHKQTRQMLNIHDVITPDKEILEIYDSILHYRLTDSIFEV